MPRRFLLGFLLLCLSAPLSGSENQSSFAGQVFPLVAEHCLDCHDSIMEEGGLNLELFEEESAALQHRDVWKKAFDMVEAGMMPPPKRKQQPTAEDREQLLESLSAFLMQPDPELGAIDPGKPVLRRLNRLEYNNTVRDLLGLDVDLFMFPERLPVVKTYFDPAADQFPDHLEIRVREYGARYPVLLPHTGLPGENRAAHGFNNRGDAMNVSPLQLEKYVALAGDIVNEPSMPFRSEVFANLIGVDPATLPRPEAMQTSVGIKASEPVTSAEAFAGNNRLRSLAPGSAMDLNTFRAALESAVSSGIGGVFDVPEGFNNQTVAGKGGLIKVNFGHGDSKRLTINPNEDLWLVSFATALETSGNHLIANHNKDQKVYELTFEIKNGGREEGIETIALCVLSRNGQSGPVTLKVTLSDRSTQELTADIAEGAGAANTLFAFQAPEGLTVHRVEVDGSRFSGEYVLIDDIGFITSGEPVSVELAEKEEKPKEVQPEKKEVVRKEFAPARERLSAFLRRAFRRPVTQEEVDRYHGIYESLTDKGVEKPEAMKTVAQAILASPQFLFLAEPVQSGAGPVRELTDHELASRLSYFLWSTMPDEELFVLADRGRLKEPAVLAAQAERMLKDPKIRELSESFAVQWLRLDQLYTAKPDERMFRDFYAGPQGKNTLHSSMLMEALLLFETVLIEDRGILDFVAADYSWLNPRLMRLYGYDDYLNSLQTRGDEEASIPGQPNREVKEPVKVADNEWFRVPLPDDVRGGYMTMAGPLTVTSLPFRTSPVKRGAWLLETIFNRPPPEPKVAFVLKDDEEEERSEPATVRERFEQHRSDPACFNCHVRLDPPGFALEAFNPIGAWREKDGEQAINASGVWNGLEYEGPAGFKEAVLRDPDEFTRGFVEHLMSYALGRELAYHDMKPVKAIVKSLNEDHGRFSTLVTEIVKSDPFRTVRNESSN